MRWIAIPPSMLSVFRIPLVTTLLSLLVSLLLGSGPAIASPLALPIHQIRQQPNGLEVSLTGTVTVPSGCFASASFDQGFAIQDAQAGIYISTDHDPGLHLGDVVTVVGTLGEDGHGQRLVQLQSWQRSDRPAVAIAPQPVSIQTAAQLDGQLVVVTGTLTRSLVTDAPFGDRLWIQDATSQIQVYIPQSTGIHPQALSWLQPGTSLQVTGLSSQYDGKDEVIPRQLQDLQQVAPPA